MLSPHFQRPNVKSMISRSHVIRLNDMNNVMCYINYDICCVYTVVCCVQNVKYDDACYSHGITFYNHVLRKEIFLLIHVLGV